MARRGCDLLSTISVVEIAVVWEMDYDTEPRMEVPLPLPLQFELFFELRGARFEPVSSLLGFDPGAGGDRGVG